MRRAIVSCPSPTSLRGSVGWTLVTGLTLGTCLGGCDSSSLQEGEEEGLLNEAELLAQQQVEEEGAIKTSPNLTPDANENKPMSSYTSCMYLKDANTWTTYSTYASSIGTGPVSLSTILTSSLNRIGPAITTASTQPATPSASWKYGFQWESGDQSVQYWVPQGMTQGSVGSTYVALASWYYRTDVPSPDPSPPVAPYSNKGVRIAIANISQTTAGSSTSYRLALLVTPTGTGTYAPVVNHAGGLMWVGNYLYVADTSSGVRVFDLANIREMSTASSCSTQLGNIGGTWCAYGYRYVIPEVSRYTAAKADGTTLSSSDVCFGKFSWLGKDTTQTSKVMLSGEYCNDSDTPCNADPSGKPGMGGRLYRWAYSSSTGKLVQFDTSRRLSKAEAAYFMNKRNVQGAAPVTQTTTRDDYRLASTRGYGSLFLANFSTAWKEYDVGLGSWSYYPEGLHASATGSGNLWVMTEGRKTSSGSYYTNPADGGRALYAVDSNTMYK